MQLSFKDKLLVEQIRCMEEAGVLAQDYSVRPDTGTFPQRLAARAHRLVQQQALQASIGHAAQLSRRFTLVLMLIAAFSGGLAVQQAVAGSTGTLNIYWLMLVLLGVNFLSLVLWLAGMLGSGTSANGLLNALWHWVEPRIAGGDRPRAAADRGWLVTCHHGVAGRWWLSGVSHGLWIVYLAAGFVMLLLLLMTRQYDFVWATTILADDVFIGLTQILATPLRALGFTVPDLEQVQLSRRGGALASPEAARRAWALFLLGGLLIYGVLPRLLLLACSRFMQKLARQGYQLDLTLPYYVKLHRELMPESCGWKVVDPDSAPAATAAPMRGCIDTHALPQAALWVGVELTAATHWPPPRVGAQADLGQVTGSATLAAALDRLDSRRPLVVAVSLQRLPDRGVKRTLDKLFARRDTPDRWLAVLKQCGGDQQEVERRLHDWMALAQACGVPVDQLAVLDGEGV